MAESTHPHRSNFTLLSLPSPQKAMQGILLVGSSEFPVDLETPSAAIHGNNMQLVPLGANIWTSVATKKKVMRGILLTTSHTTLHSDKAETE